MSEEIRMWVEISFNLTYLVIIWGLVITLINQRNRLPPELNQQTKLVIWVFGLLTIGSLAYNDLYRGNLHQNLQLKEQATN